MTVCPTERTLARKVDGELSRNEDRDFDAHVAGCARCRGRVAGYERLVALLREQPHLEADRVAVGALGRHTPATPQRRRVTPWAAALLGPLAAAVALLLIRPGEPRHDGAFHARGDVTAPEKWVRLRLYRRGETGAAEPVSDRLRHDDAVLVAYDNAGPEPYDYLMVYAVDAKRRVRWYYPPWTNERESPRSVRVRAGAGVELRDAVRHDLATGPLRIVGLFTREPLSARQVDDAPERTPPGAARIEVGIDVD